MLEWEFFWKVDRCSMKSKEPLKKPPSEPGGYIQSFETVNWA
jgi:hypothetical protein